VTSDVLTAAGGLALTIDPTGACRIAWRETDWFGPAGISVVQAGRAWAATLAERNALSGHDALGDFHAVELRWSGLPIALRTVVRAYDERPLLVFSVTAPAGSPQPAAHQQDRQVS
jgi:hypothetical protein